MGGGGGILGGVTEFLFGKPKVPDIPTPEAPAVQSPITKQDTGAIVKIGAQDDDPRNTRTSGGTSTSGGTRTAATKKRSSTLGGFGKPW